MRKQIKVQFLDYITVFALQQGRDRIPQLKDRIVKIIAETPNLSYRLSEGMVSQDTVRYSVWRLEELGIAHRPNGLYGAIELCDNAFISEVQERYGPDFLDWPVEVPFTGQFQWQSATFAN